MGSSSAIYFSKWSRKGYALFGVQGRVVHIGHLTMDIAPKADGCCSDRVKLVVDSACENESIEDIGMQIESNLHILEQAIISNLTKPVQSQIQNRAISGRSKGSNRAISGCSKVSNLTISINRRRSNNSNQNSSATVYSALHTYIE